MEESPVPAEAASQDMQSSDEVRFRLRPYQTEMVEASLKENIIVAVRCLSTVFWMAQLIFSDGHG